MKNHDERLNYLSERIELLERNLKELSKNTYIYFGFLGLFVFFLLIVVMTGR